MNGFYVSSATVLDSAPTADAPSEDVSIAATTPLEFVGSSDDTIAEAVRRALSRASTSLRTLEGVGVVVMPQIDRQGASPRFQVTLRISQGGVVHCGPVCPGAPRPGSDWCVRAGEHEIAGRRFVNAGCPFGSAA